MAVALFSGGKDSTLAIAKAREQDLNITGLVSVIPTSRESLMFHYPIEKLIRMQADRMQLPLYLEHADTEEEELDLLEEMLEEIPNIDAVISGAIASNYQKTRIDKVCNNLGVKSLTPLWHMDQEKELHELLDRKFEVIISSVSAAGFNEEWLGRKIDEQCIEDLKKINEKYGINLSGEGGEYCTTVLNCPLFSKGIKITKSRKVCKKGCDLCESFISLGFI